LGNSKSFPESSLKRPYGPKARYPLWGSAFMAQKICNTFATKQPQMTEIHVKIQEARQGKNGNRKTLKPLRLKGFSW